MKKRIYVDLEITDYEALKSKAGEYNISPAELLKIFVYDLVYSDYSQGSDERELANEWFYRSAPNF